nr:membrane protein [bacterium]
MTDQPLLAQAGDPFGGDLYRDITQVAGDTPSWFQHLVELGTEGGILILLALFVAAWWRARRGSDRAMALALLAPVATGVAYMASEVLKVMFREERPCRAVSNALPLAECPEPGDWSFPSNHSVIAAGAAFTLFLIWRVGFRIALPVAVLTALSRIFLGVHYLHDVIAGFAWGAIVAPVVLLLVAGPGTLAVAWLRSLPVMRPLVVHNLARRR